MAHPTVTPEQVREACARYGNGRAAAAALGLSRSSLCRWRHKLGLAAAERAERAERERAAIVRPLGEAVHLLGCSAWHIYRLRKRHGLPTTLTTTATETQP